jgi:hypothetical protein
MSTYPRFGYSAAASEAALPVRDELEANPRRGDTRWSPRFNAISSTMTISLGVDEKCRDHLDLRHLPARMGVKALSVAL